MFLVSLRSRPGVILIVTVIVTITFFIVIVMVNLILKVIVIVIVDKVIVIHYLHFVRHTILFARYVTAPSNIAIT